MRFVGPATAAALEHGGYDATAIIEKRVSYRMLVDAGVNPGVAAKIRREHSLSWSFNSSGDLGQRSAQIRGLGTAEAEWIAASAGDWEQSAADSTDTSVRTETAKTANTVADGGAVSTDSAWRARSKPTPVTDLEAVDAVAADRLAEAGITSVRSLAAADPDHIADVLELPHEAVDGWHQAARSTHNQST